MEVFLLPDGWLLGWLFEASRAGDDEGGDVTVGTVAVPGMLVSELRADSLREGGQSQFSRCRRLEHLGVFMPLIHVCKLREHTMMRASLRKNPTFSN